MVREILTFVSNAFKFVLLRIKFRWRFPESYLKPVSLFPINCVDVGKYSYGPLDIHTHGPGMEEIQVRIGNYVSIAGGVKFLVKMEHRLHTVSTYPFNHYIMHIPEKAGSKGPIIVNDDVWIGENALILSGVTIGQGAVVAAGAVVTKDVEPYAIVGGVPAKLISYRHPENIRKKLMELDFSQISCESIIENVNRMYEELDERNIDEIISLLNDRRKH